MLNTVIKGTKTIAEYKELKEKMEHLTEKYYNNHKSVCENWDRLGNVMESITGL